MRAAWFKISRMRFDGKLSLALLSPGSNVLPRLELTADSQRNLSSMEKKGMRVYCNFGKITMLAAALVLMSFTLGFGKAGIEYKFKVHNNTKQDIKKIWVSEDKKNWGQFDIGSGIKAGATDELVCDKPTDNERCEQWFKATFANGE